MRNELQLKYNIISFDCTDHDPIEEWTPEDLCDFDFWMNFSIGTDEGADNYLLHTLSPNHVHGKKSVKYALVLYRYDLNAVLDYVNDLLEKLSTDYDKLSEYLYWEYSEKD